MNEKLHGVVGGHSSTLDKEMALKEQDLKSLEKDLKELEVQFPEKKEVLNKSKSLLRDNMKLRELLSEQNTAKPQEDNSGKLHFESLLLSQILEYERDRIEWGKASVPSTAVVSSSDSQLGQKLSKLLTLLQKDEASVKDEAERKLNNYLDGLITEAENRVSKREEEERNKKLEEERKLKQKEEDEKKKRALEEQKKAAEAAEEENKKKLLLKKSQEQASPTSDQFKTPTSNISLPDASARGEKQKLETVKPQEEDDDGLADFIDQDPWASKTPLKPAEVPSISKEESQEVEEPISKSQIESSQKKEAPASQQPGFKFGQTKIKPKAPKN